MILNNTETDNTGRTRVWCTLSNGDGIMWQFDHIPTQDELLKGESDYLVQHQYDKVSTENINIYDDIALFKQFIQQVQANPTITVAQYNTWLGTKQWYETAMIRYYVFKLATQLANHQGLTLSDYTETQVLGALRNFIVATPITKLAKILGYVIT